MKVALQFCEKDEVLAGHKTSWRTPTRESEHSS